MRIRGFTLLEILIALLIFSILSLLMMNGLHQVISIQEAVESKATELRDLQLTMLMLATDIEQMVERPITNKSGREESAFTGSATQMTFTHLGYIMPIAGFIGNQLQRSAYTLNHRTLTRTTWPVVDQAPSTQSHFRELLPNLSNVRFEYLGNDGKFSTSWPASNNPQETIPKAIRVYFSLAHWGQMSQLFLTPAALNEVTNA